MLLLDVISKKEKNKIPFWFMRQAGRYLPEYMSVRNTCKSSGMNILDMCYNVDIATEITLQPIHRFNLSAAIIFSDILVVPHALGWEVDFIEDVGPKLQKFELEEHLNVIRREIAYNKYSIIGNLVKNVRSSLLNNKALIGFSGCPFTLACYMIDGGSSNTFEKTIKMIHKNPNLFDKLINILTLSISDFLSIQIGAGANCIQLFDSHAGLLYGDYYNKYIIEPTKIIIDAVRRKFPKTPIICFPKGSGIMYKSFSENVKCDVISIDNSCTLSYFSNVIKDQIIQGNLNNYLLAYGSTDKIMSEADKIIKTFRTRDNSFIFNLSHGIIKDSNMKNIEILVQYLQQYN